MYSQAELKDLVEKSILDSSKMRFSEVYIFTHYLEKKGFKKIGLMKIDKMINNKFFDCFYWEKLKKKLRKELESKSFLYEKKFEIMDEQITLVLRELGLLEE